MAKSALTKFAAIGVTFGGRFGLGFAPAAIAVEASSPAIARPARARIRLGTMAGTGRDRLGVQRASVLTSV